jgi:chromosome segregation ATPase
MTASKRKNENVDDVANQLTKMVIVGNHGEKENNVNQYPPTVLLTTIERMKKLSEQWEQERPVGFIANKSMNENKPYDTIAQSIGSVIDNNKTDIEIEESLLEQAEEIKSNLSSKIEQAQDLRKKETGVIGELSAQLSNFHDQRQNLLRQIEELDDQQHLSQEKIAMYQAEASQELDMILDV